MAHKLHALLAVANTKKSGLAALVNDTIEKFKKPDYFKGHIKTLKMIEDTPQNAATERAAQENRALPTTVHETLEYMLKFWADHEDVLYQTNKTNQRAVADLVFRGQTIATSVPVDELLGLENRLEGLRKVMAAMPTLSATVEWVRGEDGRKGSWKAKNPNLTTKTEKTIVPQILVAATEHHPAQIDKIPQDKTVGTFSLLEFSGACTSQQKADVLATLDELLVEVKNARMRANDIEAVQDKIGETLVNLIMEPFTKQ